VVQGELELLQLHVNTHPGQPIPIVLMMSGQLISGELVAQQLYHKVLSTLPSSAQLVSIDSRADGHVYLLSSACQHVLKIDVQAVQGFGPATPIGKPKPVPAPGPATPAPGSAAPGQGSAAPPKKPV
jgi:hypothetical protein